MNKATKSQCWCWLWGMET